MEAVVLAGGFATRLWPITRHRPKMLLPIGETTVIDRILAELEADERIEAVYVSTNEAFADEFRAHLAETPFEKPQLSVEGTAAEDEKLGVVGALGQLVDREEVDDDLLVVAGDNVIGFDLGEFVDFFERTGATTLAAHDVGSRERATAYGVVDLDGERVVGFQEKPDEPASTLVSIACYAFPRDAVRFEEYLTGDNNPDEPGWFLQWLVETDEVYAFPFEEAWFDIGTAGSYLDAVAYHLDGDSLVAEGAAVADSDLDTVHVMDGAEVTGARLARTVVFPAATVREAGLRGSIVDRGSRVEGVELRDALVGEHARILGADRSDTGS